MSIKYLAALSLGAVAMPAAAQECDPTDFGRDMENALRSGKSSDVIDALGTPDASAITSNRTEIMTWIDAESASSLVIEVDSKGTIVDMSFTANWLVTKDADTVASAYSIIDVAPH